jgi:hypothetical protein
MSSSAANWARRGDPNLILEASLKTNPSAEARQRDDLSQLMTYNKNPRLLELTSADTCRSASYLPKPKEQTGVKQQLFKVTTKSLSRATGEPLRDVTQRLSQVSFSPPPRRKAAAAAQLGMSETDIEDAPVMKNYDTALKLAPPSFGHRPGSASRTFNPVTMGTKKDRGVKKRKGKVGGRGNVTGVMSTAMLKALLSGDPALEPPTAKER